MKKLLLVLLVILPVLSFSQKLRSENRTIVDLNTDSIQYLNVVFTAIVFSGVTTVIYTDNLEYWFLDEKKGKKKKFANITVIQNFMYSNGWEFLCYVPKTTESISTIMTFKRKENNINGL